MSGDQLNLDAIERMARHGVAPHMEMTLDLVAEVRRLRAQVERVEALAEAWNEAPDYTPTNYDSGRVDQRHNMTAQLLDALDAGVSR